jgi:ferritin-like metal-binding protein YciE
MSASNNSAGAADTARSLFIDGAVNIHSVEKEAEQIIERQLDRVTNYPEVAARLRQHLEETRQQMQRIDRILDGMDEGRSALKDTAMKLMGNLAALAHTPASDEILKNSFANLAFENYEIAAYKSLITLGEEAGFNREVEVLRESLREEQDMARWIDEHIDDVTRQYLARSAAGAKADR